MKVGRKIKIVFVYYFIQNKYGNLATNQLQQREPHQITAPIHVVEVCFPVDTAQCKQYPVQLAKPKLHYSTLNL